MLTRCLRKLFWKVGSKLEMLRLSLNLKRRAHLVCRGGAMKLFSFRLTSFVLFLTVIFLLTTDFFLQHKLQFTATYLDHIERIILLLLGLVFLTQSLHISIKSLGKNTYALATLIISGSGILVAGRHIWLQQYIEVTRQQVQMLTSDMQHDMPVNALMRLIMNGTKASTHIQWVGFDLTLTECVFIIFLLFFVGILLTVLFRWLAKVT